VLIVAVEIPSLQLPLGNHSPLEILGAAQFGDGAAAAIVSNDERGPEIVGTESVLLPETIEGGKISGSETGLRLQGAGNLPRLIRGRVRELVERFVTTHQIDQRELAFVLAHPRGLAVLEAVAEGLSLKPSMLRASRVAWERGANMIAASIYRVFVEFAGDDDPPKTGELGLVIAFGIGVACEMALLRWRSAPTVVSS
jgi:alkylresorcinol/alkylpyrone synthase